MMVEEKILTFINEMGYLNNEHVLGILFYGSFLTGFNTEKSDIDLHIIFDDNDPNHLIRGNKIIDKTRIEYFDQILNMRSSIELKLRRKLTEFDNTSNPFVENDVDY